MTNLALSSKEAFDVWDRIIGQKAEIIAVKMRSEFIPVAREQVEKATESAGWAVLTKSNPKEAKRWGVWQKNILLLKWVWTTLGKRRVRKRGQAGDSILSMPFPAHMLCPWHHGMSFASFLHESVSSVCWESPEHPAVRGWPEGKCRAIPMLMHQLRSTSWTRADKSSDWVKAKDWASSAAVQNVLLHLPVWAVP